MASTLWGGVMVLLASSAARAQSPVRMTFEHAAMGTRFGVVLYAPRVALGERAATAAFARIDALERVLSDYLPDSEVSRLADVAGTGRAVPVSDDLWDVLTMAHSWNTATAGAFDVTIGPLTRLWRWAARRGVDPPALRLHRARAAVGARFLRFDPTTRAVELLRPGMRLDFGAIGKGYAADEALRVLAEHGITAALIDAGGDVVAGDPPPGQVGWRVAAPALTDAGLVTTRIVELTGRAIATSGDRYKHVQVDGVRRSHILNPAGGAGLAGRRLVTVVAPTGTAADVLATAVSVLGVPDGLELLRRTDDAEGQVLEVHGDVWVLATTGLSVLRLSTP